MQEIFIIGSGIVFGLRKEADTRVQLYWKEQKLKDKRGREMHL